MDTGINEKLLDLERFRKSIYLKRKMCPTIEIYVKGVATKSGGVKVSAKVVDIESGYFKYYNHLGVKEGYQLRVEDQLLLKVLRGISRGSKVRIYYTMEKWKWMRSKGAERELELFKREFKKVAEENMLELEYTVPYEVEEQRVMAYLKYKEPEKYGGEENE